MSLSLPSRSLWSEFAIFVEATVLRCSPYEEVLWRHSYEWKRGKLWKMAAKKFLFEESWKGSQDLDAPHGKRLHITKCTRRGRCLNLVMLYTGGNLLGVGKVLACAWRIHSAKYTTNKPHRLQQWFSTSSTCTLGARRETSEGTPKNFDSRPE